MAKATLATPRITVRLYKTISRTTIDGTSSVSARYQGKDDYIDLTPFLGDGSTVRTSKSVREPAGAFNITFSEKAQQRTIGGFAVGNDTLETIYGLVEPMDIVEIRMWRGTGPAPAKLPIKMRGFVSSVSRGQVMGEDGKPLRQVIISGHDYGKIWQTFQVLYLAAYTEGKSLLTNYAMFELFGGKVVNAMTAADFIKKIASIVNEHMKGFMPERLPSDIPKQITIGDDVSVKHGVVNMSNMGMQGSLYDIAKLHGDVGVWNELYLEDREDGVHLVYRPIPALYLTKPEGAKDRRIQDDAPEPVYVTIPDHEIASLSTTRGDDNVANFFWVTNEGYDLITDTQSKLAAIPPEDSRVSLKGYPNADPKYYGTRPMFATTHQGEDETTNQTSGLAKPDNDKRDEQILRWLDKRRDQMMQMNKDNVVYERGTGRVKGNPMRADGIECMKAGDYALFQMGALTVEAYAVQIEDEFVPFRSYITTIVYERGTGFAVRTAMEGGMSSPWLAEQSSVRAI